MKDIVSLFLILVLFSCQPDNRSAEAKSPPIDWSGYDFTGVQEGDIILKKGRGILSQRITEHLKENIKLSHCGIITRENDSLVVVHSVAKEVSGIDGVQKVGFTEFLGDCLKGHLYIVRLKDDSASPNVLATVKRFVERGVPFDYKLDHRDSSGMFCTELVYWCLKSATSRDIFQPVSVGNAKTLGFNCMLDTANFQIVCKY